jgi:ParB/RepB/Spo0J family partition protein
MAITAPTTEGRVALERIRVPDNIRDLDAAHVDALAGSIELQGMLVPVVVRRDGEHFELVAGFHRVAAARKLGLTEVPCVEREADSEAADRAVENVARKDLNPYEEARAVRAMLDRGLTEEGAAQALGWPRQRVAQRAKLLALPDDVARAFGDGWLTLSSLEFLLDFHERFPAHAALLARYLIHAARESGRANSVGGYDLAWSFGHARRWAQSSGVDGAELFFVILGSFRLGDYVEVAGGQSKTKKKIREAIDEIGALQGQRAYGTTTPGEYARVEFADEQVDQARALGVLLETDRGAFITDRAVLKQLMEDAALAYLPALRQLKEQEKEAKAETNKAKREAKRDAPPDPYAELDADHKRKQRDHAVQARPANLALGDQLLRDGAVVDPASLDVAHLFVYGLLGPRARFSGHKIEQGYELKQAGVIAAAGLRICVDELSSVEITKLKSGKDGKPKVVYADVADAERWMWKFVDGATTAGELYGRALVVLWAAHYALDEVLAHGERRGRVVEGLFAYDVKLIKILERLGKRHVPAQLSKLRRAIAAEASAYRQAKDELAAEAARRRHLERGYLDDELDERGWPKPEAQEALVRRQRIADRDRALANGVPEDEIAIDADGNFKPGREQTGNGDPFQYAEDELDDEDPYDDAAFDENLDHPGDPTA